MSAVLAVTRVGGAVGARAAAAALACAGSESDRAGLLIDLADTRPPRPSLLATGAARQLEERLATHMPGAPVASRGQTCHLTLPADATGLEILPAALPLVRDTVAVLHLAPRLLQSALMAPGVHLSGALLRGDLERSRALVALVVRDLAERGIRTVVLKRSPGWIVSRRAGLGALTADSAGLPPRLVTRLLSAGPQAGSRGGADGSAS